MFINFDDSVLEIIEEAKEYTKTRYKLYKLGTESLLYVMFKKEESICRFLLEDYRVVIEEIIEATDSYVFIRSNNKDYTEKFLEVIEMAKAISKENNSTTVLEEHFLFALLVVKDTIFEALIKKLNLNSTILIEDLKEYFYIKSSEELDNYSVNLSNLAKENKLNKMIGREHYLERMKIVLGRKSKNNILLVGSAGVGKTALVEGLCYELLKEKSSFEIISINISSLIANTKYRGDFEGRINKVLNEVITSPNKILFIDEIHTIVGAGSSDNSLDVANIIKPYLVRDNFRCIGATTAEEYERYINKDKALARRFQTIFVNELNEEETANVLTGILDDYRKFHNVDLDKKYIPYLIKLCNERIINRKFPDKAIDLMDEAMCIAKINGSQLVKIAHIDEALKNICGMNIGKIDYDYKYHELEPFFLDNYLGVLTNKNLVTINYSGDDENLKLLTDELKLGFGISNESILELNLTNYSENNLLSSLIGTSPGYVGYEDGGILSEHYAKYLYQIIVIKKLDEGASSIKNFLTSLIKNGVFYDKKGREFKTNNSVFIVVEDYKKKESMGFIPVEIKSNNEISYDLKLSQKNQFKFINPYIDSFKYKGFDISFNEEEFSLHQHHYKKGFLELLKKYSKGKYFLSYNNNTDEIEIINH